MSRKERKKIEISVENLSVCYAEIPALFCEELKATGSVIAVIGQNGAGKSTFIKTLLGLLPLNSGAVITTSIHNGNRLQLIPEQHMAFCPEAGSVFTDISVEEYVRFWCRVKHQNSRYYLREGAPYVELLQLEPLFSKLGRELSKGQRRRVQTAIGFLAEPSLFLFDEPFDGLDVQRTHELVELIRNHRDRMSFLMSSHRMDVVERLADFLLVLREGKFIAHGQVEEVTCELGGKTLVVVPKEEAGRTHQLLSLQFQDSVVTKLGRQCTITSKSLEPNQVQEYLKATGIELISIEEVTPSLVDAMTYHLKQEYQA
jgi:ABC-2 type transport system ATP-binding protein